MGLHRKWRIVYPGRPEVDEFPTERKTYDYVEALRASWASGYPGAAASLTVQVDERAGSGWEPYEHINFAEERPA